MSRFEKLFKVTRVSRLVVKSFKRFLVHFCALYYKINQFNDNIFKELEFGNTSCFVWYFAYLAQKTAPKLELGITVRILNLKQLNQYIKQWAALFEDLIHLVKAYFDENMSELLGTLTVSLRNNTLN